METGARRCEQTADSTRCGMKCSAVSVQCDVAAETETDKKSWAGARNRREKNKQKKKKEKKTNQHQHLKQMKDQNKK